MSGISINSGLTVSTGFSIGNGISTGAGLTAEGFSNVVNPAVILLGNEYQGLAIDFIANDYAMRTLDAGEIIGNEPRGLVLEFLSNTYVMRTVT